MRLVLLLALIGMMLDPSSGFDSSAFRSPHYVAENPSDSPPIPETHRFYVALKMKSSEILTPKLLDVSDPKSLNYGKFMSQKEIADTFGSPALSDTINWLKKVLPMESTEITHDGVSLIHVRTTVAGTEKAFGTKLGWHTPTIPDPIADELSSSEAHYSLARSLRAVAPITGVPSHLEDKIKFVSLNSHLPTPKVVHSGSRDLGSQFAPTFPGKDSERNGPRPRPPHRPHIRPSLLAPVTAAVVGNDDVMISFTPYCNDGEDKKVINQYSPPCSGDGNAASVYLQAQVQSYANNQSDPFLISTQPILFDLPNDRIYCFNTYFGNICAGDEGDNCTCVTRIKPLPKYQQFRLSVIQADAEFPSNSIPSMNLGTSAYFVLTDVATPKFLQDLYSMPRGQTVRHGSNQSVVEFLGEFYSNEDLSLFLRLSGLAPATIPPEMVFGDKPNDDSNPGGEAQLDVEVIVSLAPNADTYFYSFSDLNPFTPENEGFLAFLQYVTTQEYPPLVYSMSYGDEEKSVYNPSSSAAYAYGQHCDDYFQLMGLRGLTVIFASGDDGVGGTSIRRDDWETNGACSKSNPEWPAGSPYITSVGATMLTDQADPMCGKFYSQNGNFEGFPPDEYIQFGCTGVGETVCTSLFGGVITSGGGFSNVADRNTQAPWQSDFVERYLQDVKSLPPFDYFNAAGRAYPDISAYGSNYFVIMNQQAVRESGTSASTPLFAAMVTLWNDMRLSYGLPPMGFIAPFLYAVARDTPEAFQDVTTGNNACGAGSGLLDPDTHCCEQSFSATAGWDATTGLGTPNFHLLSSIVINPNTFFPALGAFPNGGGPSCPSQQAKLFSTKYSNSKSSDDDSMRDYAIAGLTVASVLVGTVVGKFIWGRGRSSEGVFSGDDATSNSQIGAGVNKLEEVPLLVGNKCHFQDYKSMEGGDM
jgi:hypothetical protein